MSEKRRGGGGEKRERRRKKEGRDGIQDKMVELTIGDIKKGDEGAFTVDRLGWAELVKSGEEEEEEKKG